jgi:peptidoglycan/LPS O-acetylase OafA/YrhL
VTGSPVTTAMARLAAAFRRVTTSGGYVPEIDGLRFIAIAAVVAVHTWGYWSFRAGRTYASMSWFDVALERFVSLGFYGVHLFFMISGFILAVPFCRHAFEGGRPVNLRAYFWRRITRLEPPYVLTMLVFFALMPLAKDVTWAQLWPHLLASLGYVHNIVYGQGSLLNNNAWTLEIEVQFYLLMPLLALALRLPALPRRAVFAVMAIVLSLHGLWLPRSTPQSVLQYGQYFLVGILLCDLWTTDWRGRPRTWMGDLPGILAWPVFVALNLGVGGYVASVANPWVIAMLFYSALRGIGHGRGLSWAFVPIVGGMCYSIYLLHARAIAAVVHGPLRVMRSLGGFTADYLVVLVICSLVVVAVSAVFFLLVEKPCMDPDWPRKLWQRLRWAGANTSRSAGDSAA